MKDEELAEFLREVDRRLAHEGLKATLYVLGGAAAVIAHGSPRATIDIDAWMESARMRTRLQELAGEGTDLARKHGVYLQSANTTLMLIEEPEWRERCVEVMKGHFKNLKVLAAGKEDLILSKLSRYNDRDREDIRFICEERGADVKKLISFYKAARQYYVGNLATLDQTFNIVLEEHFGRKPIRF